MTDSVFDEMKEVLALQKKAHIDEGPASYELRLDRLNRLSQMLKKYSDEIVDTISEDYGTRDKNSTFTGTSWILHFRAQDRRNSDSRGSKKR